MDDDLLTTAEAARIAGVGTTSVKRWADQNLLQCVKTAGGHRRIRRQELERFLHAHGGAPPKAPRESWLEILVGGDAFDVQGAMLSARGRLGAWYRVTEELAEALVEVGDAWRRGDITILEEHVVSEKLARALARCSETLPLAPDAPTALLTTAQNDDHTLGLSLVELCLRELGWRCVWAGRRTPIDEIMSEVARGGALMLLVSASAFSANRSALEDEAAKLGDATRDAGVALILGGSGAWPERPKYGTRVRSLRDLHEAVKTLR